MVAKARWRPAADNVSAVAYSAGWALVRHAPEGVSSRAFDALADRVWVQHGAGVQQLEKNLQRTLGAGATVEAVRDASRLAMRSYLRYWREVFTLPSWDAVEVARRVEVTGFDAVAREHASGRGVVLALPHSGNWDLVGAWLAQQYGPFTTVAERLNPESLYERFLAYRRSLGMEVLPHVGDGAIFATLAGRLRAGAVVCLMADRDVSGSGVDVDLLGEPARIPAGPAALAVATGAALFPVSLWYDNDVLRAQVAPEVDLPTEGPRRGRIAVGTADLAQHFGHAIRQHPMDWHMLQPIWNADRHDGSVVTT